MVVVAKGRLCHVSTIVMHWGHSCWLLQRKRRGMSVVELCNGVVKGSCCKKKRDMLAVKPFDTLEC